MNFESECGRFHPPPEGGGFPALNIVILSRRIKKFFVPLRHLKMSSLCNGVLFAKKARCKIPNPRAPNNTFLFTFCIYGIRDYKNFEILWTKTISNFS